MNVIFLTMSTMTGVDVPDIYTDLMRKFRDEGHNVYIVTPRERRMGKKTQLYESSGVKILGVKTLNLTKTNVIEKGIGQVTVESLFKKAVRHHLGKVKFDLILYSTPPITLTGVVQYIKKANPSAMTYLLLKDIFPQNAVDLGMLKKTGLKGVLYRYFRNKEKALYGVSDYIGCMSPANVRYIIEHNKAVAPNRVEESPNSYELKEYVSPTREEVERIRLKYNLPIDKPIFIYGGNLGKPQGVPFAIQCLEANKNRTDCHFVVLGDGTEYTKMENWYRASRPTSVSLFKRLPKEDYDQLLRSCDVGLIFLDYRFTIPNYPSRLLPYLMEKKPIIACTDPYCDTGSLAEQNGYGYYCPSNSVTKFTDAVNKMLASEMSAMGEKGYQFFVDEYTVDSSYNAIMNHF